MERSRKRAHDEYHHGHAGEDGENPWREGEGLVEVKRHVVLSLAPCQRAARDETTGRWDISGTISGIIAGEFPAAVILAIYIAIRRGDLDRQQIDIAALSPTGAIVGSAIVEVTWTTDEIAELSVAIPLQFATPGTYTLRLFTQDRILIERPMDAKAE